LLRHVIGCKHRKTLADFAIDLVNCGGECHQKQLLPEVFKGFVGNGVDQGMEDLVPSIVVPRANLPVQLCYCLEWRGQVVRNWMVAGKCLEVVSGRLCVECFE
jgi:hypothetical protein